MMSDADMAALQNAQGVDASRLFLQQMIQHHQGAITMAQNEINRAESNTVTDRSNRLSRVAAWVGIIAVVVFVVVVIFFSGFISG